MKKRATLMVIALLLIIAAIVGCTSQSTTILRTTTTAAKTEITATTTGTKAPEKIQLEWVRLDTTVNDNDMAIYYKSPAYIELVAKTGCEIKVRGADKDQAPVYIASNDLGDLVTISSQPQIKLLTDGNLLTPLNALVEKSGPNIMANRPERWTMAKNQLGINGMAYVLPIKAGGEGRPYKVAHSLYNIRWDYYKELGYPTVKNEDDFLTVLSDMVKLHPKTADGLPTFGTSFYLTTTSYMTLGFSVFRHTYGFRNGSSLVYMFDVNNNGAISPTLTNMNDCYWRGINYFRKAYLMGILDPDALTQQAADYTAKADKGQLLSIHYTYNENEFVQSRLVKDPNSLVGYEVLPVEGVTLWTDSVQATGWEAAYLGIPKKSKQNERVIQLLNYTFSYDGARFLYSGIEGVHWKVVNGKAMWTDETIAMKIKGGNDWKATGVGDGVFQNLIGLGNVELNPKDNSVLNFERAPGYLSQNMYPVDKDYSKYYGVTYPMEKFAQLYDAGKINTHLKLDLAVVSAMGGAKDDITLIDTTCVNLAIQAIPNLIQAKEDSAFAAIKAKLLSDLSAAGYDKSIAWWQARHQEVLKSFGK